MRRLFFPITILVFSLVLALLLIGTRPVGGATKTIEIKPGTSRAQIAQQLKEQHIIHSPMTFLVLLVASGGSIQSGIHTLDPKKNLLEIVGAMRTGRSLYITITIPEGWRKEQIAQELTKKNYDGQAFLQATENKEGYLFPDTYFLPLNAKTDQILEKFSINFSNKTKDIKPSLGQIILASIVEREAKKDEDRPIIAGIYLNRIKKDMALEADPTVQYAKETSALLRGETVNEFWQPITVTDYQQVISAYNTYLNKDYPPGPICNPGLKSITAAVHPAQTDALYFFHTQDGKLITSKTLEEHNKNKQKYL